MIEYILLLFGILIASIFFHEVGHISYLEKIGKKTYTRFYWKKWRYFCWLAGKKEDYKNLTNKQYYFLNMSGVISGLIPSIIIGTLIHPFFFLMIFPYLSGCIPDIKEMWKAWRE